MFLNPTRAVERLKSLLQSLTAYQYSVSGVKQNRAQYEHAYHNTGIKITDPLIPPVYKRHTYI